MDVHQLSPILPNPRQAESLPNPEGKQPSFQPPSNPDDNVTTPATIRAENKPERPEIEASKHSANKLRIRGSHPRTVAEATLPGDHKHAPLTAEISNFPAHKNQVVNQEDQ
jgi:hypothetical protein